MVQSFNRSLNSDSRSSLFGGLIITLILTLTIHQVMVNAAIGAGKSLSMLDTLKGNSFLRYSKVKSVSNQINYPINVHHASNGDFY